MTVLVNALSGVVGAFNNADYYSFTVIGTQTITLDLSAAYGSPSLYLFDSSGNQIYYNYTETSGSTKADATIVETLAAGTYYAEVFDSNTSPYTLDVETGSPTVGNGSSDAGGNTLTAATPLGTLTSTPITIADYIGGQDPADYYSFKVGAISNVNIELSGLQNSAYIYLLNAAGNTLASYYSSTQSDVNMTGILPVLAAGTYYVEILASYNAYPTGYNLAIDATAIPNAAGGSIATARSIGALTATAQSFSDAVNAADTSDYYSFTVTSASTVSLWLRGVTATAYMQLLNASGSSIGYSTSATTSGNGSIVYNLAPLAVGTYYVEVSNYDDATNYTLTASASVIANTGGSAIATATRLTPSVTAASVSGFVGDVNTVDYYTFTLGSSATLNFRLTAGSSDVITDAQLTLYNSANTSLANSYALYDQDSLVTDNLGAGTYTIAVSQYSSYQSPFVLTYSTGAPVIGTANVNQAGATLATARNIGALTATPAGYADWVGTTDTNDYYQFTLTTASTVHFDVTGQSNNLYLTLENISGASLASASGGSITDASMVQQLAAGTYYLDISDPYNSGTGYNLAASATSLPNVGGISLASADNIGVLGSATQTVNGWVGYIDNADYIEFQLTRTSTVNVTMLGLYTRNSLYLDDVSGNQITEASGNYNGNASLIDDLSAGTYFLTVYGNTSTDYTLTLNAVPIADSAGPTLGTAGGAGVAGLLIPSDLNGDGTSDIVWRNAGTGQTLGFLMDNGTEASADGLLYSSAWTAAGIGDFNGDGTSDILWRNAGTGQVIEYLMDNGTATSSIGILYSPVWTVAGVGDFNGDGTSDILWRNAGTGQVVEYLMNNGTETSSQSLVYDPVWTVAGTGDFNGDGTSDILWRNTVTGQLEEYLMNNGTLASAINLLTDIDSTVVGAGDFTGDGIDDILLRNRLTGRVTEEVMNANGQIAESIVLLTSQSWTVAGTGDYTGNGTDDILWRNAGTGQVLEGLMSDGVTSSFINLIYNTAWQVSGSPVSQSGKIPPVDDFNGAGQSDILWVNTTTGEVNEWQNNGAVTGDLITSSSTLSVVGAGDFYGDGDAALLVRNSANGALSMWQTNGLTIENTATILTDPNSTVVGTGDFYGNGDSDILMRNAATGATVEYEMAGSTVINETTLLTNVNWTPVGVGDFNGDGTSDILWRNPTTGAVVMWTMNGGAQSASMTLLTNPSWTVAGVGDFGGDDMSDIVWRNASSGQVLIWMMNGSNVLSSTSLLTNPAWTVTGVGNYTGNGNSDILMTNSTTGQSVEYLMNGSSVTGTQTLLTSTAWHPVTALLNGG